MLGHDIGIATGENDETDTQRDNMKIMIHKLDEKLIDEKHITTISISLHIYIYIYMHMRARMHA